MSPCLARQPIFDKKLNVIGYELLYRSSGASLAYDGADPDQASADTIMLSMDIGSRRLTGNRLAFINFTEKMLLDEVATILPKKLLVVEILENVRPSAEVIQTCYSLKKQGYLISLDDFSFSEQTRPFLDFADIIKIDFLKYKDPDMVSGEVRKIKEALRALPGRRRVQLLAEKVESHEVYRAAADMGFSYFQGFFFSKPEIMHKRKNNPLRINQLKLVRETMDPMVNYKKLTATITSDPILSYRILRLVNSVCYGLQYKVKNIGHALAILGIINIRKYVTLLAIEQISEQKPRELFRMSLVRGHFLETLAPLAGMGAAKDDLFMLGLFSLMDVITETPMREIVEMTNLADSISFPLLTNSGKKADLLRIIEFYEKGDWDNAEYIASIYGISPNEVFKLYLNAVEWADGILC